MDISKVDQDIYMYKWKDNTCQGVIQRGGALGSPPRNQVMFEIISEHTEYLM